MNAWKTIRNELCKDCRPNTIGMLSNLFKAAMVYNGIRTYLRTESLIDSDKDFNSDQEVRSALFDHAAVKEVLGE